MSLPRLIFANASPHSIGGISMFAQNSIIVAENVAQFSSAPDLLAASIAKLRAAGFEVLSSNSITINFAGPPELFEQIFNVSLQEKEVEGVFGGSYTHLDTGSSAHTGFIDSAESSFGGLLEGVALEVPRLMFAASPVPPTVGYWHLDIPHDVAAGVNATPLHRLALTGAGVKVAMVDSGWFRHPYFDALGYDVAPVVLGPAASEPDHDESGHGTGESANILAIAPGCQLLPVKANFVNTIGAFNAAVALQPDIITCSWGSHTPFVLSAADVVLGASIAAAKASGITVIFSAGNGHAGFPGQHPDVISAGGVFMRPDGTLEASNYSSGFDSLIFPGRRVPDVSGLVGMKPKAIYIMLPVEPGDSIDTGNATGGPFPDSDETTVDDGWAAFSGTSAAAPQLAGVAALIKQVVPDIAPCNIKAAMVATARDVSEGMCNVVGGLHQGIPSVSGPDSATGAGLIDAYAAVVAAYTMSVAGPALVEAARGAASSAANNAALAAYYYGIADAAQYSGSHPAWVAALRGTGSQLLAASAAP